MTQTTILAVGVTAATSADIVIAAGSSVTVGIFTDSASIDTRESGFTIFQDTPGLDVEVSSLTADKSVQIAGPGTFRVKRTESTGKAFGVFIET